MVIKFIGLRRRNNRDDLIIHFCNKCLANTYYVPDTVLGAAITKKSEQGFNLLLMGYTYK